MAHTVKQEAGIAPNPEKPKLKRSLGLLELTLYGIGIILGAGIYAIIGQGAGVAGNALWLSFVIGAIIAAITGLSYAELGTMFPKEAAEYVYMKKAFKREYPAFLIGWLIIIVGTVAASVVALGFGGYLQSLTGIPPLWGAIGVILACSFLNYWGIRESANANIILTSVEMLGLILIIIFGFTHLGSVDYFEMPGGLNGVMMAAVLVFFAYVGFEDIVNLAEETNSPKKIIPKALILSIVITTILYILVSMVAVSVVPWDSLAESGAPLAVVAEAAVPGTGVMLSVIALFATANTILILLIVESRMAWGMAREKSLPKILSKIHPERRTPWVSIILITVIGLLFALFENIRMIAEVTDLGIFIIFISVNASLIWLRYKRPDARRPFKMPINIRWFPVLPAIGILITLAMFMFFNMHVVMIGLGILVVGTIVYYILKRMKR